MESPWKLRVQWRPPDFRGGFLEFAQKNPNGETGFNQGLVGCIPTNVPLWEIHPIVPWFNTDSTDSRSIQTYTNIFLSKIKEFSLDASSDNILGVSAHGGWILNEAQPAVGRTGGFGEIWHDGAYWWPKMASIVIMGFTLCFFHWHRRWHRQ